MRRVLERPVHAPRPRLHRQRHEAEAEQRVGDHDGAEPPRGAEVEEEGEERCAHHDLGRGEGQHDQEVDGGAAAHPVAAERHGDQAAQDRGEHAGDGRHLDALDERVGERALRERMEPVVEGEPLPRGVELRGGLVEREHRDRDERDEQVDEHRRSTRSTAPPCRAWAAPSYEVLRAEHARVDQHHHGDDQHQDEADGGRGRVVAGLEEPGLDDAADHRLVHVAEQVLVDEVARGRDEHEERAGEHPGQRHREDHPPEGVGERRVEVAGGVEEVRGDPLEAHVDRQEGEGQEVVDEPPDDRRRRVEDLAVGGEVQRVEHADQVQRLGEPEHRTVVGEQRLPGDRPQQEAGEERHHHQPEQQVAPATHLEGDEVGQRVRQQDAHDGGDPRVAEGPPRGARRSR